MFIFQVKRRILRPDGRRGLNSDKSQGFDYYIFLFLYFIGTFVVHAIFYMMLEKSC